MFKALGKFFSFIAHGVRGMVSDITTFGVILPTLFPEGGKHGVASSQDAAGGEERKEKSPIGFGADTGETKGKGGRQKGKIPPPKESAPKSALAAVMVAFLQSLTNDERNHFNVDLINDLDEETRNAILALHKEALDDVNHPTAENRFARILTGLVADARVRYASNQTKYREFLDRLGKIAKTDPERFKQILELSDNNALQQYLKAADRRLGQMLMWLGNQTWLPVPPERMSRNPFKRVAQNLGLS